MNLFEFVLLIVAAICLLPYVRVFFKRLSLYVRLCRLCREKSFSLIPARPLWFFASKRSGAADFYVETPDTVFSVKLFAVRGYHTTLILDENGTYRQRSYIGYISHGPSKVPYDSELHRFPDVDFRRAYRDEWTPKQFRQILLLNPTSQGLCLSDEHGERMTWNDDRKSVRDMEIFTLSRLLGEMKACA